MTYGLFLVETLRVIACYFLGKSEQLLCSATLRFSNSNHLYFHLLFQNSRTIFPAAADDNPKANYPSQLSSSSGERRLLLLSAGGGGIVGKSSKATILYGEGDSQSLKLHTAVMEKAGYAVETAVGRRAIEEAIRKGSYDLVVLGHKLTRDDRHHLPYMVKKANQGTRVLVIHASGKHHAVDASIDSRDGDRVLLEALAELLEPAYA